MGNLAERQLDPMVDPQSRSLRWLHGALAVALRQAVHVGARRPTAPACAAVFDLLAEVVPAIDPDRPLHTDVLRAADLLDRIADRTAFTA